MRKLSGLVAGLLIIILAHEAEAASRVRHDVPSSDSEMATASQINPAHTGSIDFAAGFSPPLKQAWSRDLVYDIGTNQPLVADGAVFVSAGGFNFSLDIVKGRELWMKGPLGGYLSYDNGNLFSLSDKGILSSFDPSTGKTRWTEELPDEVQFFAPQISINGQIFAGGLGVGGRLYAVDETTGSVQWENRLGTLAPFSSPAYGDNGVIVTYPCHYYKFDPATGKPIWKVIGPDTGGDGAPAVYFDKKIMVLSSGSCGSNAVIKAGNGKAVGSFVTDRVPVAFTDKEGRALAASVYQDQQGWALHCWVMKSGKELWRYAGDGQITTPPVAVNGQLVVGSGFGKISMLNEKGQEVWTTQGPQNITTLTAGLGTLVVISGSIVTAFVPQ